MTEALQIHIMTKIYVLQIPFFEIPIKRHQIFIRKSEQFVFKFYTS